MTWRRRRPDADGMVLLCTLHWPEAHHYYLSRRYPGCWDFWVLLPGEDRAQQIFGWLDEPEASDREIGAKLLADYVAAAYPGRHLASPPVPALLGPEDLQDVLAGRREMVN